MQARKSTQPRGLRDAHLGIQLQETILHYPREPLHYCCHDIGHLCPQQALQFASTGLQDRLRLAVCKLVTPTTRTTALRTNTNLMRVRIQLLGLHQL